MFVLFSNSKQYVPILIVQFNYCTTSFPIFFDGSFFEHIQTVYLDVKVFSLHPLAEKYTYKALIVLTKTLLYSFNL